MCCRLPIHHFGGGLRPPPQQWGGRLRRPPTVVESIMVDVKAANIAIPNDTRNVWSYRFKHLPYLYRKLYFYLHLTVYRWELLTAYGGIHI